VRVPSSSEGRDRFGLRFARRSLATATKGGKAGRSRARLRFRHTPDLWLRNKDLHICFTDLFLMSDGFCFVRH
jgi:hypothetical protein